MYLQKQLQAIAVLLSGIFLGILLICCKDDTPTEPQYDFNLVGNWKVNALNWDGSTDSGSYNQRQLDSVGVVWNLNFESDNTAEQITNLSGLTTSQSGTWSNTGNKLMLNLKAPNSNETGTMVYTYTVEDNLLKLNWLSLLGDGTIFDAEFTKQ